MAEASHAEVIARAHVARLLPPAAVAVVTEDADAFVVTFPMPETPGTRELRGDFYARVRVARGSGAILKTEVSP